MTRDGREFRRETGEVKDVTLTMTSCIVQYILHEVWKSDPANSTQTYSLTYTHTYTERSSEISYLFFSITLVSHQHSSGILMCVLYSVIQRLKSKSKQHLSQAQQCDHLGANVQKHCIRTCKNSSFFYNRFGDYISCRYGLNT